ncbi:N-acetylmuramoyl-L-alanine amidase [Micavibrio aeruginosavorus]|uniref:N-acetylmuramoyl-L-alanine amidase n=1 Tax=Micavibrio aeruginosavorus TaxID=349221 RepID=UPI003F4AB658
MAGVNKSQAEQAIAATLAQKQPMTWQQVYDLQTNLRALDYAPGKSDGDFGSLTSKAVMRFYNEHPELAASAGSQVRSYLSQNGHAVELKNLADQNAPQDKSLSQTFEKSTQVPPSTNALDALIGGPKDLTKAQIKTIQNDLNAQGIQVGIDDGILGPKTAGGIVQHLAKNPSLVDTMSPDLMRDLMRNGQNDALVAITKNSPALQARIGEMIKANPDLATTTDHAMVSDLQTLLIAGGHGSGGVDGVVGSQTINAVDHYMAASGEKIDLVRSEPKAAGPIKGAADWLAPASQPVLGDNGFGVPNATIERAWSNVSRTKVPHGAEFTPVGLQNPGRPLVVIDLGHGEDVKRNNKLDDGAISAHTHGPHMQSGLSETEVVDSLAKPLAARLQAQGYDVAFTRNPGEQFRLEGDKGQTLHKRPEFAHTLAREMGASDVLFVSIHANSASNPSANGSDVYTNGGNRVATSPDSQALAGKIAGSYHLTPEQSTGIHAADLGVLRHFEKGAPAAGHHAAVLLEVGFLSNPKDAKNLAAMAQNPDRHAQQIADGIAAYGLEAGLKPKPLMASQSPNSAAFNMAHNNTANVDQENTPVPERAPRMPSPEISHSL